RGQPRLAGFRRVAAHIGSLQTFGRLARTVMAPARRLEQIAEALAQAETGRQRIPEHADPFVERHLQRVEGADVLDDAVARAIFLEFLYEGAEHPIPDDQRPGIVRVEIARIGCMVHAVVRRRVEDQLYWLPHLADRLGVDPELPDEVEAEYE